MRYCKYNIKNEFRICLETKNEKDAGSIRHLKRLSIQYFFNLNIIT